MSAAPDTDTVPPNAMESSDLRFVGRHAELNALTEFFSAARRDGPRILSVCGSPGEGKTRLVQEFCIQWRARYKNIYWINSVTDMTVIQSFVSIAADIGFYDMKINYANSIKSVRAKLQSENDPWLMVFDSYDYPDMYPDITRLVPTGVSRTYSVFTCDLMSFRRWKW